MYVENITSNGVTLNSAGKSMQIEVYEKRIKELEEENKTLKELNVCVGCDNNPDYKTRIDKAIEYIGNGNIGIPKKTREKFIRILKGEENE